MVNLSTLQQIDKQRPARRTCQLPLPGASTLMTSWPSDLLTPDWEPKSEGTIMSVKTSQKRHFRASNISNRSTEVVWECNRRQWDLWVVGYEFWGSEGKLRWTGADCYCSICTRNLIWGQDGTRTTDRGSELLSLDANTELKPRNTK